MRVRILGCSGGIGVNLRTTSLLVDNDILIDCGTGVGELEIEEMAQIRHIFLTHSHMDHIACLPLLVDTLFDRRRGTPLMLHCQPETYDALSRHIFNWKIWPNFFALPDEANAVIRYSPLLPGEISRFGARCIETVKVNHSVPGVAYRIANARSALAYSGDTTTNDEFWRALNAHEKLDLLIIECAFSDTDQDLSEKSMHYCPSLLAEDMTKLKHRPKTCITHLKPGEEAHIFEQVRRSLPELDLVRLYGGEVFDL